MADAMQDKSQAAPAFSPGVIGRAAGWLRGPGLLPRLVHAGIGSALVRVAGMGFGFLFGVQLARGLGPSGYGIYGLAMSIITVLAVPIQFGLPQLVVREVAAAQAREEWGRVRGILRWSSRAVLITSAVTAVAVLIGLLVSERGFGSPFARALLIGVVMLPLLAYGALRGATLLGLHFPVRAQAPNELLRPAMFSLLLFAVPLVFRIKLDPALAMGLGAASAGFAILCYGRMLHRALPAAAHEAAPQMQPRAWRRSAFPMALSEGMRVLQGQLMTLVLGMMQVAAVVGVFRVASSVALLIATPVSLLNVICAPLISRLHTQGAHARLQRMISWVALAMTIMAVLLMLPFFIAGHELLGRIFGHAFAASNAPLLILCVGVIGNACCGLNAQVLNMVGLEQRVTRAFAISLVVLALLTPPMVYAWQDSGAALASTISVLLWNVLMWRDAWTRAHLDTSVFSFMRSRERGDG